MSVLKDLVLQDEQKNNKIEVVTIIGRLNAFRYVVKDNRQRQQIVSSEKQFFVGDTVSIRSGLIIGRTRQVRVVSHHEV